MDERNPWTTLSSQTRYENPWIRVVEHQVLTPAGRPGIYGVVSPKNLATGVVPVFDDGTTLLVGQWRYALDAYSWEIPEGGCPAGMTALDAARRELREETGCTAGQWLEVQRLHLSNSISDEACVTFVAWEIAEGCAAPEETEVLRTRRLPFAELVGMVGRGEITDAPSVATVQRLELMRLTGRLPEALARRLG